MNSPLEYLFVVKFLLISVLIMQITLDISRYVSIFSPFGGELFDLSIAGRFRGYAGAESVCLN